MHRSSNKMTSPYSESGDSLLESGNKFEETIQRPLKTIYATKDIASDKDISIVLQLSFIFISFGYMLPWTALGSLISYYKYTYGAGFYVKIYCAYYLPGLPVALLQYRYDEHMDNLYGSKNTYMVRGVFAFTCSALILFSMLWFERESQLIALFTLLGMCSWMCHGTASMMASMYPKAVIAYLQIGFRCPEIYIMTANLFLDLGRDATVFNLSIFYKLTALIVLLGLICWILVVGSQTSISYFADKDFRRQAEDPMERTPLIAKAVVADSEPVEARKTGGPLSISSRVQYTGYSPIGRAKHLIGTITDVARQDEMLSDMFPLCGALVITIWSSIFQAAFFAYVSSSADRDIEQILYFTRLISDLFGRPLTFLPRPSFLQTNEQLLVASFLRALLLVVFFVYTFARGIPKNDLFIVIFVGLFSVLSGYFTVLIYEHAAKSEASKASRAHATNILNMSFQFAAFMAVCMSVAISETGWLPQ